MAGGFGMVWQSEPTQSAIHKHLIILNLDLRDIHDSIKEKVKNGELALAKRHHQ